MPDIVKVLKNEISRLARKETKRALAVAAGSSLRLRRTAAEMRRKIATLEKEVRSLQRTVDALGKTQPPAPSATADKARITAKGMRSLRRRLGLTGQEFARLLGVTGQVIYGWEKADGALRVRRKTREAILAVRGIGAREARRRLAEMAKPRRRGKARRA
jgi:DNA-binding transcriptional regulator YiaG